MHYGKSAFGINGKVTIVTIDASMQDKIGQRHGMSEIDIVELNAVYEWVKYDILFYLIIKQMNNTKLIKIKLIKSKRFKSGIIWIYL